MWERQGFEGLPYSDGEAREAQLLAALKACRDVGTASAELRAHISDWPSEYHLSPARHNLLRALPFGARDRVLELGCGCGAITRFLGESGAAVLGVEGSRRRAEIAAERCRDLANVRIACDNLASFDTAERFDVVTLIGVLEYSRRFIDAPHPVLECLRRARAWLADGGVLVLAIENRLGMKYFAGCAEDHLDRPWSGVEDLYGERTAVTFGKSELSALLVKAGFRTQDWYYPFPDYKVPSVLVAEEAMAEPGFDVPSLVFRARSRDYRGSRLRVFDESLARREAWKHGLLADTANSFLVLAHAGPAGRAATGLACAYNVARHARYCTAARFEEHEGALRVERSYLWPAATDSARFSHRLVSEPYSAGPLLVEPLHRLARTGLSIDGLARWATPWVTLLKDATSPQAPRSLPGHYIDCTPFNCVHSARGLAYIDAEWSAAEPVPLAWVFIRGLAYALGECLEPSGESPTRRALIERLAARIGPTLTPQDFDVAEKWERAFQAQCRPLSGEQPILGEMLDRRPGGERDALAALDEVARELERTRNSRSWKLTQPLRSGLDLLRRLRR
ncbi:MAG: class I SAM-dependent methyltransferase [Betaproteobacteria bacterium]